MIYISNFVHQLHQCEIFSDVINDVKYALLLPPLDLITRILLYFISFPVNHDIVSKFDLIIITLRLTCQ